MGRVPRLSPGGYVYHVLNRGNARAQIFDRGEDYAAFLRVMRETLELLPMRLLSYCLMPNHWHLVLWSMHDGELPAFMQRLTLTHVRRRHAYRQTTGTGLLYQGAVQVVPGRD